ncbi:iron-sulfur cluster biosynthesis family protein [Bacillus daqingensis]|uniref:Iron-sulfur cluster biosynthesis family protein n=1 Tax=Bacillus daqingensis TaxID=872396 RepID=A0ABV9NXX8_9BACI
MVNGVVRLAAVTDLPEKAEMIETNTGFPAAIEKGPDWLYENELILDYRPEKEWFQLKSAAEMLSPSIKLQNWN